MERIKGVGGKISEKPGAENSEAARRRTLKNIFRRESVSKAINYASMAIPPTHHLKSTFVYWKNHPDRPLARPAILLMENIGGYTLVGVGLGINTSPDVAAGALAAVYCTVGALEWRMIKKHQAIGGQENKEQDAPKHHMLNWDANISRLNYMVAQYQVLGYSMIGYAAAHFIR